MITALVICAILGDGPAARPVSAADGFNHGFSVPRITKATPNPAVAAATNRAAVLEKESAALRFDLKTAQETIDKQTATLLELRDEVSKVQALLKQRDVEATRLKESLAKATAPKVRERIWVNAPYNQYLYGVKKGEGHWEVEIDGKCIDVFRTNNAPAPVQQYRSLQQNPIYLAPQSSYQPQAYSYPFSAGAFCPPGAGT